jgi:hypothetical protein
MSTIASPGGNQPMPTELLGLTREDRHLGVSMLPGDRLLPIIGILQSNSPECDRRGEGFCEGAEPGLFHMPGTLEPFRASIDAILVERECVFLEWPPGRTGNLIGRHEAVPPDATRHGKQWVRADGNVVQETWQLIVLADGEPWILPCHSTRITFARQWLTYIGNFNHPQTNEPLPSFCRRYRLSTAPRKNALGGWYTLSFDDQGWVSATEYAAARAIALAIKQAQHVESVAPPRLQAVPAA